MAANVGSGIKIDEAHDKAEFGLGELRTTADGRSWRYIKATAAVAQYDAVIMDAAYNAAPITATNAAAGTGYGKKVGVPQVALAANQFGWACVEANGDASMNVLANAAAFTRLRVTATEGKLDDTTTATTPFIAGAVITTANGGSTAAVAAVLSNPKVELDLVT